MLPALNQSKMYDYGGFMILAYLPHSQPKATLEIAKEVVKRPEELL